MFKTKTVRDIYERTVAELEEVEQLNERRRVAAEAEIDAAKGRLTKADDDVVKARQAKQGFAQLFGMES